jgi:hypothetical protein
MREKLMASEESLLGKFYRYATDEMIFECIVQYTHKRALLKKLCPLLAEDSICPFNECVIYLAFHVVDGKYKFKIGQTTDWRKRSIFYQLKYPNIQLVFAFDSCFIVEKYLLFLCTNSQINAVGKESLVGEW